MAKNSTTALAAYYRQLPADLKSLHMYFRAASDFHAAHRPAAPASVQGRRWAREELEARVFCGIGPEQVMRQCERALAADRDRRIATARGRRGPATAPALPFDIAAGNGTVIPFARRAIDAPRTECA